MRSATVRELPSFNRARQHSLLCFALLYFQRGRRVVVVFFFLVRDSGSYRIVIKSNLTPRALLGKKKREKASRAQVTEEDVGGIPFQASGDGRHQAVGILLASRASPTPTPPCSYHPRPTTVAEFFFTPVLLTHFGATRFNRFFYRLSGIFLCFCAA